ncbi:hypothetical protein K440DRAFT_423957 [Wilcoxina mikolae CBS 423.85]|nr:hypothetical protein K440DRAFT_423957 [Wilcoxina mikolae CBS 423.85]
MSGFRSWLPYRGSEDTSNEQQSESQTADDDSAIPRNPNPRAGSDAGDMGLPANDATPDHLEGTTNENDGSTDVVTTTDTTTNNLTEAFARLKMLKPLPRDEKIPEPIAPSAKQERKNWEARDKKIRGHWVDHDKQTKHILSEWEEWGNRCCNEFVRKNKLIAESSKWKFGATRLKRRLNEEAKRVELERKEKEDMILQKSKLEAEHNELKAKSKSYGSHTSDLSASAPVWNQFPTRRWKNRSVLFIARWEVGAGERSGGRAKYVDWKN